MNPLVASCSHRPPCPGCPRFGKAGISSTALSRLRTLARENGLPEPAVHEALAAGYRHRARLAVRGRMNSPKIGIFQEGSHRVVDIPSCVVHHPLINDVAGIVKRTVRHCEAAPYSDMAHAGLVRYLQVAVERSSQTAQVVIVTNGAVYDAKCESLCNELQRALGERLHSLFWNGNPDHNNVILGPHWRRLSGPEAIRDSFAGVEVFYPPGAFGQSNLGLYERLVARVHAWAEGALDGHVVELYAGTGAIGLGLSARAALLELNEISTAGLRGLELGVHTLPPEAQRRTRITPGSAAEVADTVLASRPALVIADPPRKGLAPEVVAAVRARRPRRFIYVSCDLDSFERDANALLADNAYRLAGLEAFALFPYTDHVETVAWLEATGTPA